MSNSTRGDVNGYFCKECGEHTFVVHVDDGVTPMFLACRASGDVEACKGMGTSLMYPEPPIPDYVLDRVGWEWYRPDEAELRGMDEGMREHIERGGVALRPLTTAGTAALGEAGS
jgi:hypothetical protein